MERPVLAVQQKPKNGWAQRVALLEAAAGLYTDAPRRPWTWEEEGKLLVALATYFAKTPRRVFSWRTRYIPPRIQPKSP